MPLIPPDKKKKMNDSIKTNGSSKCKLLFTKVINQCIILVAAGTEIITVSVLYNIRVV